MPWTETTPVDERLQFVTDAQSDRFTMAELCARYGVSRRVGYKWVHRYAEEGRRGLDDGSTGLEELGTRLVSHVRCSA